MKGKKRVPVPGWDDNPDNRERPLLPQKGGKKIETYI